MRARRDVRDLRQMKFNNGQISERPGYHKRIGNAAALLSMHAGPDLCRLNSNLKIQRV
jgi:hypothetical protein